MRFLLDRILKLVWVFLLLTSLRAGAQTADEAVAPYGAAFQYGTNLGYYGAAWTDEALAGLAQARGSHSIRPTLPEYFVEQYGYNIRLNAFSAYINTLGMKEITCFVEGPSAAHRDPATYPGGTGQSKLFAHLYDPIWNPDGSVNPSNYYAIYLYRLLQTYGDKVRFWEVVNETDFTNAYNLDEWLTRPPTPGEQVNTQAPIFHYIRMLRISYEVVKKYRPDAYITTGGLGYPQYLDALLRYTDNPNGGAVTAQYPRTAGAYFDVLSFHCYPSYSLHYWDNALGAMRYTRTSDYAATRIMSFKDEMVSVLNKYGYNGTTRPRKHLVITEANVARRTSDDRTGSDELQRNFGIKALVLSQKNDIRQFYYYSLGEGVNAPPAGTSVSGADEIALMGLHENLNRDAPGAAKATQLGHAFATTSQLLYNYRYDAARTAALALPAAIEGAAFAQNGTYVYVLWAKALTDNSEQASASYSFPTALGIGTVQRLEWDHSATGVKTTASSQGLALSSAPAFFTVASTGTPTPTTPPTAGCSATGTLLREQWSNVGGTSIASIPVTTAPSVSASLTQFEASSTDFNYGARLRGYVCPPQSGAYTFSIVGDDACELWLSTDDQPASRVRIASCAGWTSGPRDFTRYASQQSAPVSLAAGRRYYIEALHKQGWGSGFVAVAWRLPNGTFEAPIAGSRLSPFGGAVPVVTTPTPTPTPTTPPTAGCSATGTLLREQWSNVGGTSIASIPVATTPSASATLTQFESLTGQGFNYGARLRGYVCPPQSGAYTFSIVGDDACELWLSTDDQPAGRVRIASCAGWTSGPRDFTRYASQQSAAVTLQAGRRYYIEALHKQAWGNDYLAVAWRLPNGTFEAPIAGSRLSPFTTSAPALALAPAATSQSVLAGTAASSAPSSSSRVDAAPVAALAAYPNPFTREATVEFSLSTAGPANLALYDLRGQLVRQLFNGSREAGPGPAISVAAEGLSQGIYLLRLTTRTQVLTQKLVLNK